MSLDRRDFRHPDGIRWPGLLTYGAISASGCPGAGRLTGSSVEAVTTWHFPAAYGLAPGSEFAFDFEANAKNTLAGALAEVSGLEAGIPVRSLVTCGVAAEVLLHEARGADLLVVGSRVRLPCRRRGRNEEPDPGRDRFCRQRQPHKLKARQGAPLAPRSART
jgi:hypothetical protein